MTAKLHDFAVNINLKISEVKSMASVNYKKLHGANEVKSKLMHCDKFERLEHEHSNEHINKANTLKNKQSNDYADACQRYDKLIEKLDKKSGANKRKDRVTCFGLEIPRPKDLPPERMREWSSSVLKCVQDYYAESKVVCAYIHLDEVHEYIDAITKETVMSREHVHIYIVPEHNGKLNGKWFSNASNMKKMNNLVHEMTERDYGVQFMDGSKRKGPKVEFLKQKSRELEQEASAYPKSYKSKLKTSSRASKDIVEDIRAKQKLLQAISKQENERRLKERVILANDILKDEEQEQEDIYSVFG